MDVLPLAVQLAARAFVMIAGRVGARHAMVAATASAVHGRAREDRAWQPVPSREGHLAPAVGQVQIAILRPGRRLPCSRGHAVALGAPVRVPQLPGYSYAYPDSTM